MRIDLSQIASGQAAWDHESKKVESHALGGQDAIGSKDRTTFSSDASSVGSLVGKAMNSPEIRHELVNQLKESVNGRKYSLDPNAIASSMLDEHA